MFWARLGSLHALSESAGSRFWKQWLRSAMPSADSFGRVFGQMDAADLRHAVHGVYTQLKRNKALPGIQGLGVAIVAGHESCASYRRHCSGCLQRTMHTESGDRIQYYHRNVTLMLAGEKLPLLLDLEPQRRGEDAPGGGHQVVRTGCGILSASVRCGVGRCVVRSLATVRTGPPACRWSRSLIPRARQMR